MMASRLLLYLFFFAFLIGCATNPSAAVSAEMPAAYASVPTVDAESGILPPRAIRRIEPVAPAGLIGSGRTVEASVGAVINTEGGVEAVWLESGDPVWGRALAEAVGKWTFRPATKDGEPVAVRFSINSKFTSRGGGF